jgi:hypothetical protein
MKILILLIIMVFPIIHINNYSNKILTHDVTGCNLKLNSYHPRGVYRTVVVEQEGDWYITENGRIHRNLVKELWCN